MFRQARSLHWIQGGGADREAGGAPSETVAPTVPRSKDGHLDLESLLFSFIFFFQFSNSSLLAVGATAVTVSQDE